jgi:hypothetical protein
MLETEVSYSAAGVPVRWPDIWPRDLGVDALPQLRRQIEKTESKAVRRPPLLLRADARYVAALELCVEPLFEGLRDSRDANENICNGRR